jgi:predicted SAM-dependent methyltransferase
MKFDSCIRCNNVTKDEIHLCFFCGSEIKQNLKLCNDCTQWKCPKCGKCYCDGTNIEKKTLEDIYNTYCLNELKLLDFDSIKNISGDETILQNANKELKYCSSKLVRLNMGCGLDLKKGYINVDLQDIKNDDPSITFIKSDCGNLSFIRDRTIDEVYANQLLEHIHPLNIKEILYEWRRVLKIGGILRIVFPDFEKVIEDYGKCKNLETVKEFMSFLVLNYVVLDTTQQQDKVRDIFPHKSLMTTRFLTILLESEGFGVLNVNEQYQDRRYSTEIIAERILRD